MEEREILGVIIKLGDQLYSIRTKENGTVKRFGSDGVLLHFDENNEYDFEYTYWNELRLVNENK